MEENMPFRSLEGVEGKVISYEVFQRCRGERDARSKIILERRARLLGHYISPAQTPEEKRLQLIKHYTDPI